MGESNFNRFVLLRNQLVIPAQNFGRDQKLSPIQIPTMSKDMKEELLYKVVDLVDPQNRMTCVSKLRYNVDKPESSNAQVQLFARKKAEENIHQFVNVNY